MVISSTFIADLLRPGLQTVFDTRLQRLGVWPDPTLNDRIPDEFMTLYHREIARARLCRMAKSKLGKREFADHRDFRSITAGRPK